MYKTEIGLGIESADTRACHQVADTLRLLENGTPFRNEGPNWDFIEFLFKYPDEERIRPGGSLKPIPEPRIETFVAGLEHATEAQVKRAAAMEHRSTKQKIARAQEHANYLMGKLIEVKGLYITGIGDEIEDWLKHRIPHQVDVVTLGSTANNPTAETFVGTVNYSRLAGGDSPNRTAQA